jgi:hypothetical protein
VIDMSAKAREKLLELVAQNPVARVRIRVARG